MEQGRLVAEQDAPVSVEASIVASTAALLWFDQIRALVLAHELPPEPPVYDLLWRYVRDESPALTRAVDEAVAGGGLSLPVVLELRVQHIDGITQGEVATLVDVVHGQARALTQTIEVGQTRLASYDQALSDGSNALSATLEASALAGLLEKLSAETAAMQAANVRMAASLTEAVNEAHALSEKLGAARRAAMTDQLTGLLNRRGIIGLIEQMQKTVRADGTALSVALIDIDNFKRVNDRFGHTLGDDVLRFVAAHVAGHTEALGGQAGRLGGEEFVALLPGMTLPAATAAVDRSRAALAGQIIRNAVDGTSLGRVSFSAGVTSDRAGDTPSTLLERADRALYTAKRMGRDRVVPDRG
jgi:diguanylate cyclase